MEKKIIELLERGNNEDTYRLLKEFNSKHEDSMNLSEISVNIYNKFWKFLVNLLSNSTAKNDKLILLKSLCILSREKSYLNESVQTEQLIPIVNMAGLTDEEKILSTSIKQIDYDVVLEAQKCLSNMIYHSVVVRTLCCSKPCLSGLMGRLRNFKDPDLPSAVKNNDLRILFLITALCSDSRTTLLTEYHCLTYLIDILEDIYKGALERNEILQRQRQHEKITFESSEWTLLIHVLKVLYNLVLPIDRLHPDEEEERHCERLVSLARSFLVASTPSPTQTEELHSNTVNLLLVIPQKLYKDLVQPMPTAARLSTSGAAGAGLCGAIGGGAPEPDNIVEYDGADITAIAALLRFLQTRLNSSPSLEALMPILTLLVELSENVRPARKFFRLRILPPLRDASRRPEEGGSVRSKLCSLMTAPVPDLKFLAAHFLFILCKESVERLIKYTGYGNAAGLLASRGLMADNRQANTAYSSDSDDSDTEEYDRIKDKVNPVTGRCEPVRPSPMEGMTEEQKEYEAMKLVEALEKLTRDGLIQPCRVGEDGRPETIRSVLQLRDEMEQQTQNDNPQPTNHSDSE